MLSTVSDKKNVILLLLLIAKIGKPIRSMNNIMRIVHSASENGVPFDYQFRSIDEETLECPQLLEDLDFLVESRLVLREFVEEESGTVMTLKIAVDKDQLESFSQKYLDPVTKESLDKFAVTARNSNLTKNLSLAFQDAKDTK